MSDEVSGFVRTGGKKAGAIVLEINCKQASANIVKDFNEKLEKLVLDSGFAIRKFTTKQQLKKKASKK